MKQSLLDSLRKLAQETVDNKTDRAKLEHKLDKIVLVKESGVTHQDKDDAEAFIKSLGLEL